MRGPDLSYASGTVNYKEIAGNIDFAILRAGYGQNNTDQYFQRHADGCKANQIPIGIYWFSYAYTQDMARKEAEYAANHAKKVGEILFVAFDFEYDSASYYLKKTGKKVTKQAATNIAKAFCNRIKELGYKPVLYANKDYLLNYFDKEQIEADLWYAYYNKNSDRTDLEIWQYTSQGKLEGINGNVDLNIMYKDYEEKKAGWIFEKEKKQWWYRHEDGGYTKNDWEKIEGKWYFFDEKGYMVTGWIKKDEKWYYLKSDGSMAENEMLMIYSAVYGNEKYAFSTDGHMLTSNSRGALI